MLGLYTIIPCNESVLCDVIWPCQHAICCHQKVNKLSFLDLGKMLFFDDYTATGWMWCKEEARSTLFHTERGLGLLFLQSYFSCTDYITLYLLEALPFLCCATLRTAISLNFLHIPLSIDMVLTGPDETRWNEIPVSKNAFIHMSYRSCILGRSWTMVVMSAEYKWSFLLLAFKLNGIRVKFVFCLKSSS